MIRVSSFYRLVCLGLCLFMARPALADHAIAMHGVPKYKDGFTHFDYARTDAPKGGLIRFGVVGTYDSLNPFIIRGTVPNPTAFSLFSAGPIYEPLMARSWDEPFSLYGLIAKSVDVPADRSSITFTLRPEARWQDGQSITVDDVFFTYETLRDKGRPNHRAYYKKVEKVEKIGLDSIRFSFKKNIDGTWDREMPLIMGLMPILPKHDWVGRDFNQTSLRIPLGSGPYRISKVDPGRSVTLTRDASYWARDLSPQKGLYNFDEVVIDFYRDENIARQAFKAGQFDVFREADPRKWAAAYDGLAKEDGRLLLQRFDHHRPESLRGFVLNARRPLLRDPVLRQAVSMAFDFGWINKAMFHGLYKRTQSYFPNAELADNGSIPQGLEKEILEKFRKQLDPSLLQNKIELPAQNGSLEKRRSVLLKAAELLRRAGYVLKKDGLYDPKGSPVSFEVMLSSPTEEKIALEWARGLKRLGIETTVRTVDSAQYQARLNSFDYDVTVAQWTNTLSPGNEQLFFWGCAAAHQQGSRNYAGICHPVIDALAKAIPAAQTREELVATVQAMDRILMAGHYVVPFYYLGMDLVAYFQDHLGRPLTTPLYGPVIESWWSVAKGKG